MGLFGFLKATPYNVQFRANKNNVYFNTNCVLLCQNAKMGSWFSHVYSRGDSKKSFENEITRKLGCEREGGGIQSKLHVLLMRKLIGTLYKSP